MAASKLEADILKVVIQHAQEHHTPTTIIMLALINCTKHWANNMVNLEITKMLYDELNHEVLSMDAIRRIHNPHE